MSTMLKRKIDEQNRLWNRMQELQRVAEDENRDWTAEERQNWDKAETDISTVSADIERLERAANMDSVDHSRVIDGSGGTGEDRQEDPEAREQAYAEAFNRYVRDGREELNEQDRRVLAAHGSENRAAAVGSPSAGGYLVPPGYRTVLVETMKAYGGLLNLANVITTSTGQPLQWPTNDDTGNTGAILSENTQISEQDVTIGTRNIGAYKYTSKLVRVSMELLQDSAFDINTWLPTRLGERIGRAVADDLVNGTGTGEPTGILPGMIAGKTGTGGTLAAGPSFDDVVDLEHSVDPAYRNAGNVQFMFNDLTLAHLRKLRDDLGASPGTGRPLWLPVPTPGFPSTINGHAYTIDQAMPNCGTGNASLKSIAFGNFKAGYIVRQVLDVQLFRLVERYADFLQTGFFSVVRLDATPDDTAAVKAFVNAAS